MTLQPSSRPLTSFSLLSFDVFGTLIDWESGITSSLRLSPFFSSLPTGHPLSTRSGLLEAFEEHERGLQSAHPKMLYRDLLANAFKAVVQDHKLTAGRTNSDPEVTLDGEAAKFCATVGSWPAFPDTVAALQYLQSHYRLVPLSNVDNVSIEATVSGPLAGVDFSAIYTAQDIGSYKPDSRNFEYLLEHVKRDFGVEKTQVLHVAQSLFHDHVTAGRMGIENVWVDRQGLMGTVKGEIKEKAHFGWRVESIGELANMVKKQYEEEKGTSGH